MVPIAIDKREILNKSQRPVTLRGQTPLRPSPSQKPLAGSAAGVEVVPVHDRVEAQGVGALCLPSPERADGEHHDVTAAERRVHRDRSIRQELAVRERARQKHLRGIGRKLQDDARPRVVAAPAAYLRDISAGRPVGRLRIGRRLIVQVGIKRRDAERRGVRGDRLPEAAVGCRRRRAAAAPAQAQDIHHGCLIEVHPVTRTPNSHTRWGSSDR